MWQHTPISHNIKIIFLNFVKIKLKYTSLAGLKVSLQINWCNESLFIFWLWYGCLVGLTAGNDSHVLWKWNHPIEGFCEANNRPREWIVLVSVWCFVSWYIFSYFDSTLQYLNEPKGLPTFAGMFFAELNGSKNAFFQGPVWNWGSEKCVLWAWLYHGH